MKTCPHTSSAREAGDCKVSIALWPVVRLQMFELETMPPFCDRFAFKVWLRGPGNPLSTESDLSAWPEKHISSSPKWLLSWDSPGTRPRAEVPPSDDSSGKEVSSSKSASTSYLFPWSMTPPSASGFLHKWHLLILGCSPVVWSNDRHLLHAMQLRMTCPRCLQRWHFAANPLTTNRHVKVFAHSGDMQDILNVTTWD